MSPACPESPANFSEEENDGFDEILAPGAGDSLDGMVVPEKAKSVCPDDDDGYGTWDDMSELEDEGLKDSLQRQMVAENELSSEVEKDDRNAFRTLMRDVGAKGWSKAESNRNLGYGSQSSVRTQRRKRQKKREMDLQDEETRKS